MKKTQLVLVALTALVAAGCTPKPAPVSAITNAPAARVPSLGGTSWQLVTIQMMDDTKVTPAAADQYRFQFAADGALLLKLDCNRGRGTWDAKPAAADSGSLTIGPAALTRMMCPPGSLDGRIGRDLGNVRSYLFKDGHLYLSLMADGGIYELAPAAPLQ